MSPFDSQASQIVTAVIVVHDGARWLPDALKALLAQTRPVQRIVGVDTGSRDRSGAVLAEVLGAESVFGTERGTGFGAAVSQALRHRAASATVSAPAGALPAEDAVEWIWLLHDDSAPERDALERLLAVGAEGRFAVLGPKARKWDDPRILVEAGLRIDRSGRRVTGLDPDEYDQGQHDGNRDVLAVGSAGMLVRRDVWEALGGFDPALPLGYDDIDFCWRANAAGFRVRLVTDAAIRHAEAVTTGQRAVTAGVADGEALTGQRRATRRSGLYVLFVNLPLGPMLLSVLRNTAGSMLHAALALLLVKRPAAAWDEMAALGEVLGRPLRLIVARRGRPPGRRRTYRVFRSSVPRAGARALLTEIAALTASRPGHRAAHGRTAGGRGSGPAGMSAAVAERAGPPAARHRQALGGDRDQAPWDQAVPSQAPWDQPGAGGSSWGEGEPGQAVMARAGADSGLPPGRAMARRIITSPGVLTAVSLVVITGVAGRSLLVGGPLGGGALVPAWGGASSLWHEYLTGFHQVSVGSAASAPPYVAVLAAVATVLGGKPWLAVDVLLLGSVPLAGVTAYLAARRLTGWVPARVWAAVSYALLPGATGAVAAGRIGAAVTIALIPLIGISAARMFTMPGRQARRAAWATGLTVAVAAAFVPLTWAITVGVAVLAALGWFAVGGGRRATLANLAIVSAVPAVLLFPWTLQLFAHPSLFLTEAGIARPGLSDPALPVSSLLMLSPGGPGVPQFWVTAGLAAAGLAALQLRRHRVLVAAGWAVALSGLLAAIVVSRLSAVPPGAGQAVHGWPGVPLMVAAAGVLLAAVAASESLPALLRGIRTGDGATGHYRAAPPRALRAGQAAPRALPAGQAAGGAGSSADAESSADADSSADAGSGAGAESGADADAGSGGDAGSSADEGSGDDGGSGDDAGSSPGARSVAALRAVAALRVISRSRGISGIRPLRRPGANRPAQAPGMESIPGLAGLAGASGSRVPWRRICAVLAALAACSAPVLLAGSWVHRGAAGPLTRSGSMVLPPLVSASPGSGARPGTLVLRPGPGHLSYAVLNGAAPLPGEAQLPEPAAARHRLDGVVAGITSGAGTEVGADGSALGSFGVGYVLLPAPVDQRLARVLDGTSGLRQLSMSSDFALWSVSGVTARARLVERGGAVVPVPSGAVNVDGAAAPRPGGTLLLAEPADGGWHASLNGRPLTALSRPADGWAQAFQLPPGGGRLDVTRDMTGHHLSVLAEGLALLVVAGLALPGQPGPGTGDGGHGADPAARGGAGSRTGRRRHARPAHRLRGRRSPPGAKPRPRPEPEPGPRNPEQLPVRHGPAETVTGHGSDRNR